MQKHHNNKYQGQKIYTYVSKQDIIRLKAISHTYGFKSVYQLQKYLVDCFLRSVDPSNDSNQNPVPAAISEIFIEPNQYINSQSSTKSDIVDHRQLHLQFNQDLPIEHEDDAIANEIKEIFDIHSEWESEPTISNSNYYGMNVIHKPDQRKIKTPDDLTNNR